MTEIYDVVVVGGGPSGLSAAWHLRDTNLLVLEERQRLGGRLKSLDRGEYWLNFGGHLFPGAESNMQELTRALGLEIIDIPGLKTAMSFDGKVYKAKRIETYPLTLPMTIKERLQFVKAGLTLLATVKRWQRIATPRAGEPDSARRERIARFRAGETFADLIGHLSPRVDAIFRSAARRAAAEPEQQSAGVGVALFGAVWNGKNDNTALNLRGGSGRFAAAMADRLGDRVRTGCTVERVERQGDTVTIRYVQDGASHTVQAKHAVVAVPATVARAVVADLSADLDSALAIPQYGSWVGMTMITDETTGMPYDDVYAMTTPDRSFDMFFNHANPLRTAGPRRPGGSLMCYAGGEPAQRYLAMSDDEIREMYTEDLCALFPQLRGHIVESHIQRWHIGGTYRSTDGGGFEPMIRYAAAPGHRIHFAGDYFAPLGQMEVAVTSGKTAAAAVRRELNTVASTAEI